MALINSGIGTGWMSSEKGIFKPLKEAKMKNVLIIGGAGFIGMALARGLSQKGGYSITILDDFFRGKLDEELAELRDAHDVRLIERDCTRSDAFEGLPEEPEQVYMFASVVGVEYTQQMPDRIIAINTQLIVNTLEWLKESHVEKVLFASTSECYAGTIEAFGEETWVPTPENVPLSIQDISNPRFTYAATKMLGESGFLNYSRVHSFDCTVVRYHNVYGPRMGFKHVIPQVAKRFVQGEDPFKIYGSDQTRAFNYIDDAVEGSIRAMESEHTNGEILHIGDDRSEIKVEELVTYIGELIGFQGSFEKAAAPEGSVKRRCPDISKAREMLGYEPSIGYEEGVKRTVEWYQAYLKEHEVYE